MFANSRVFWSGRALPMLSTEEAGGGGGGTTATTEATTETKGDDLDKIEGLGDKGKEAIRKEREAAKAAADRAKRAEEERDALQKRETEREAAEAKTRDEEATQKGEFEKLAAERATALEAAKADAKTLKAENDAMRTAIDGFLADEWKALPDKVKAAYQGADDDPLAKLRYLPAAKALAADLTSTKEAPKRGNGIDPKANGNSSADDAAAQKAQRSQLHSVF